ncbi:MAG: hypothetical protein JNM39_17075 [Bdellovibrionaceae bacterium]|nr:hypothetical protein [Pseudobdellovibrionaceae bacterium]
MYQRIFWRIIVTALFGISLISSVAISQMPEAQIPAAQIPGEIPLKLDEKPKVTTPAKISNLSKPVVVPPPLTKESAVELLKPLMEVPKVLDTALGSVNINEGVCNLNYSYSNEIVDPFGEKPNRYEILLTAAAISAKKFNEVEGLLSLPTTDQCWFYAEIESKISLNPIKVFIPGKESVTYSGPTQPFLRRFIETREAVVGGTIVFKEPLEVGPLKVTGQVSFRSHFRAMGKSNAAILKRSKFIQDGTQGMTEAYQALVEDISKPAERAVASIPPENGGPPASAPIADDPNWTPDKEGTKTDSTRGEASLLPSKITLKSAFYSSKDQKATLVLEGTYTPEQVAAGMTIVMTNKANNKEAVVYGLAQMSQKDGKWVKERIHWIDEIPGWAKNNEKK